jgi:WD40 repeat protein/tetratricopeptide (TPR) repeat protein
MNPFPGLRPFTQEEDYLFFGREEQTLELLQRLGSNRFVAVVGTSGSGKSSLVRCGLLSELLGGRMLGAGSSWEIAVTHPGGNPLALLTDSLLEADLYDREEEHARENLLATLSRSHFGLVEAVKQSSMFNPERGFKSEREGEAPAEPLRIQGADVDTGSAGASPSRDAFSQKEPTYATNFLLVVDQFEEIFRFQDAGQRQQEVANEFVSLLLEAVAQKEVPIYVVLTMRSDFIGECGQFEGLAEMVNKGEFLIPRLTREQYKRVIEGPIKVAGGQIAPRLLQRLLNDLGQQADQLPCLQHALMRTWDVWTEKGDTEALDLDDYLRVGRMAEALSLHADEIYDSLASDRQRDLCKRIFQALTVEESNNRGIRRPQRLGRLCQILEVPADELRPIIDAYRHSGVTFLMPSPEVELTEQTIIDISHESLMRVWTRLRQWVEEESQAAGIYHRLSESADLREQGKAGLYRDPELGIALAWQEAKRPNAAWAERYRPGFGSAMAFLEASQQASVAEDQARDAARQRELEQAQRLAEAERQRATDQAGAAVRLRWMVRGLGLVAMLAIMATVFAWLARQEARRNAQTALQAQQDTERALKEAEAAETLAKDNLAKAQQAGREASEQRDRADKQAQLGNLRLYYAQMHQAEQVWRENQGLVSMRGILTEWLPRTDSSDRRGWEWFYLNSLPFQNQDTLRASGLGTTTVVAWHKASNRLAEGTADGLIRIWDVGRQRTTLTLSGPGPVGAWWGNRWFNWSPDGSKLAAGFNNGDVHVWETSSGRNVGLFRGHKSAIMSVAYSSDGSRMAAWGNDGKIIIWDANTGALNSEISQPGEVTVGAWSPDDKLFACGHNDGSVTISGTDAGKQDVTLLGASGSIYALAWSPDSSHLATTNSVEMAVRIWDVASEKMVVGPLRHTHGVLSLEWDSDGQKLAAGDMAHSIKIWNTTTGGLDLALRGNTSGPTSLAWGPDSRLATGCSDGALKIYETTSVQEARILPGQGVGVLPGQGIRSTAVAWTPDGKRLVSGSDDGRIRIWDPVARTVVLSIDGHDVAKLSPQFGLIRSLAWSSDGTRVASGGLDGRVKVWEARDGGEVLALPDDHGPVWSVAWSPDGTQLAASYQNGTIQVVEGLNQTPKVNAFKAHEPTWVGARTLAWSPKGDSLASGGADGLVKVWDPTGGVERARMQAKGAVISVAWSPDGNRVASTDADGLVTTWDAETANKISTLRSHSAWVDAVVWSPDGTRLASCGLDNTVRISDPNLGEETLVLRGDTGWFHDVSWHPDGAQIAAASSDGQIWIWDATRGFERDATRRALPYIDRKVASGTESDEDRRWFVESYIRAGKLKEALALLMKSEQDKTGYMLRSKIIVAAALIPGLLEELAESASDDGQFQAELARHFTDKGYMKQANGARSAARKLFEQQMTKEPENSSLAGELADLLLASVDQEWTALEPTEMKSEGGATLTLLDDGSILASGVNPDQDVYTLVARPGLEHITAIRLEALPHPSLPFNGPGRAPNFGNFHLNELSVLSDGSPVSLTAISTLYDQVGEAPRVIDSKVDDAIGWSNYPRNGKKNTAIFATELQRNADGDLQFDFHFSRTAYTQHGLGRFRLSVSDDPDVFDHEEKRLAAMKLTDPWARLVAAYLIHNDQQSLDHLIRAVPSAESGIAEFYLTLKDWDRAIAAYSKLIDNATSDASLLLKRGEAYFATKQFDLARADWRRAVELRPELAQSQFDRLRLASRWSEAAEFGLLLIGQKPEDTLLWVQVPPVAVLSEHDTIYPEVCRAILELYRKAPMPENFERAFKACFLKRRAIDMSELPLNLIPTTLDEGKVPDHVRPWIWSTSALLAYRQGDAELAVKSVNQSEQHTSNLLFDYFHAINLAVLAMAQHDLKQPEKARTALNEGQQLLTRLQANDRYNHDTLIAEILLREAEALIDGKE